MGDYLFRIAGSHLTDPVPALSFRDIGRHDKGKNDAEWDADETNRTAAAAAAA